MANPNGENGHRRSIMRVPNRARDTHARGHVPPPRCHRGTWASYWSIAPHLPWMQRRQTKTSVRKTVHTQTTYSFDKNSGRIVVTSEPWRKALDKCKARKQGLTSAEISATKTTASHTIANQRASTNPRQRCPLPGDHYKVTYRPKPGTKLSTFREEEISAILAQACRMNFPEFCKKVFTQTQWHQNLIEQARTAKT